MCKSQPTEAPGHPVTLFSVFTYVSLFPFTFLTGLLYICINCLKSLECDRIQIKLYIESSERVLKDFKHGSNINRFLPKKNYIGRGQIRK